MAELRCAGCELGSLCSDGVLGVRMGALQWVMVAIPAVGAAAPRGWLVIPAAGEAAVGLQG